MDSIVKYSIVEEKGNESFVTKPQLEEKMDNLKKYQSKKCYNYINRL